MKDKIAFSLGHYRDTSKDYIRMTVSPDVFSAIGRLAQKNYNKEISELDFTEAAKMVSGLMVGETKHPGRGLYHLEGKLAVDTNEDGDEAFVLATKKRAREVLPVIDDERLLCIRVVNSTAWDRIRGREPVVEQEFIFMNKPPDFV